MSETTVGSFTEAYLLQTGTAAAASHGRQKREVLPAATATRASGAAASLAAELMAAIKEALVSLRRLRNAKPLAKSLWMM